MAEGYHGMGNKSHEYASNSTQVLGAAALVTSGVILLFLAGLTAVALVLLAPVLVLLSPLLIPVGALLFGTVVGLLSAVYFGLALVSGVRWFYNYVNGRRPPGSDRVDYVRMRVIDTASHAKDYAWGCGGYLQAKLRHAAPGA
ncbi:hypothetical protein SUGI_0694320 [Cryptomeria japonica]|uniref:oleosin-like n=1 Tax=Cryptomeria japonica TaxID=3369 RepID=UPI002414AD06|nr:oleosin-like [Cryptomeria japonica]GLJ34530.1 hypothetical protein SUGI_0694320 [Cryptomeria japonica]